MYCRYCGKQIPDESIYCSACGKKIESNISRPQNKTHTLSFKRFSQLFLVNPPINIFIDGRFEFSIENGEIKNIQIDAGPHKIEFQLSLREKTIEINITQSMEFLIKWDRLLGTIKVDTQPL